jgi:hypothetical protein
MASRGTPTSSPALSSPRGSSRDQAIDLDSPRPARDSPAGGAGSFGAAPPRAPSGRFTRGTPGRVEVDEYRPLEDDEDDQVRARAARLVRLVLPQPACADASASPARSSEAAP